WQDSFNFGSGATVSGEILFSYLCFLGFAVAAGCLIFLGIANLKLLYEGNYSEYLLNLLWPLLISILLSNNGQLLAQTCFEGREFINVVNQKVLESVLTGVNLQETFAQLQQAVGSRLVVSDYFQQCEYLSGDEQLACLKETAVKLKDELAKLPANTSASSFLSQLVDALGALGSAVSLGDFNPFDPSSGIPAQVGKKIGSLMTPVWESAVFSLLGGFMQAYQHFLEISLYLTAMVSPLAVGGSLLPIGARPLLAWTIGFFSIGLAKLAFNLTAGLAAVAAANGSTLMDDQMYLYVIFGFFAPMLSGGLSVLGGLALWNSLTGAIDDAVGFVGKGIDAVF
ncbi:MAG: hypothetical protein ACRDEA_02395, partial [Microcystaceae cyanobacterium]